MGPRPLPYSPMQRTGQLRDSYAIQRAPLLNGIMEGHMWGSALHWWLHKCQGKPITIPLCSLEGGSRRVKELI